MDAGVWRGVRLCQAVGGGWGNGEGWACVLRAVASMEVVWTCARAARADAAAPSSQAVVGGRLAGCRLALPHLYPGAAARAWNHDENGVDEPGAVRTRHDGRIPEEAQSL